MTSEFQVPGARTRSGNQGSLPAVAPRQLCDNPTCSCYCDVVFEKGKGWRFANGFQMSLTKEQLLNFQPEKKFNVCGQCKGGYDKMVIRMREIARQKLKPITDVVWWKRILRRLAA